jgi:hypothetical protein
MELTTKQIENIFASLIKILEEKYQVNIEYKLKEIKGRD